MGTRTIVFEERGFPVELTTIREMERAISTRRLRPDSLVTTRVGDEPPHVCRAGDIELLRPLFGLPEPEPSPPEAEAEAEPEPVPAPLLASAPPLPERPAPPPPRLAVERSAPALQAASGPASDYRQPADFIACALSPLKRYAEFTGRASRREYWGFTLAQFLLLLLLLIMSAGILFLLAALALIIPGLAVGVRRLHDQDKSGWWLLISFVPYVGPLILLLMMCVPGTAGPNRYGSDPRP